MIINRLMNNNFKFLRHFPKDESNLFIVYDYYTFDNLFKLLLKEGFDHEQALDFVLMNCSFSGHIFQDRIFSRYYLKLKPEDALLPKDASIKANFLNDMLSIIRAENQ